ncbi:uncharacterized protein LOC118562725 [Fundulus heteroclitus]|uniref:uncharacterized protein LOC118562241 n=1 Tax=Fundulus heteroclitus TaxID=8078 RepID=UPI00165B7480|nr:uncharacterized protein LOC118562241 [Fundulus heteroclitus]XP_035990396.1 uncharacterized protein LOC118562241 [Fundulus heteroclitus]XP_035991509.1 uncharacterized protein LOC118562725 [Fundulus heteroclitus]XP_035991510.1 uncharacterized protein LOC118562725 [Fundulus heteroclitus]
MEAEMQDLRSLIVQLRAENEKLRQEQEAARPGPSTAQSVAGSHLEGSPSITERFVFVPRDRKCPLFRGKGGIGLTEWLEEVQACMRVRHLSPADQAFFLFDHLEGEARDEIKFRPTAEREDPAKIMDILKELYGCYESYVALQEAFFSRRQRDGETLQEFSLALMSLMEAVKSRAPRDFQNAASLLRDQFVEHVSDGALRRELKQFVRRKPTATLLEVRAEALRWEREVRPSSVLSLKSSVPLAFGSQYGVQSCPQGAISSHNTSELSDLRSMLQQQQSQLDQLSQSIARLQKPSQQGRSRDSIICRRCQKAGHFARDCDGVRVPVRASEKSPQVAENSFPPSR